uniref:asparaginase n=1 Tax=Spongospora subterranea TaxID=70186 RepID=A0A0H5RMP0_9EUKA|eukprot:CRZ09989.1 hypothetical protein [Spongospora subterranea]
MLLPAVSMSTSADPSKSEVLIICTGGTIGMFESDNGALEPRPGAFSAMLPSVYSFNQTKLPKYDVIEWQPLIDSSNMRPELWKLLIKQIRDNYDRYGGFLILSGTDTMSYTASCLSFAFENLAKPIVITGSQIPIHRAYTDARRHLTIGLLAAGNLCIPEVCLLFGEKLFRGNRTKKKDNWGVSAFESPNCPALATFGVNVNLHGHINAMPRKPLRVFEEIFSNIIVIWLVPGFDDKVLERLIPDDDEDLGIVFMLYGSGNAPSHSNQSFMFALTKLRSHRVEIVVATQCRKGSIDLTSYSTGTQLLDLELISGRDMTVESCVTKLGFLMGRGLRGSKLKQLMESDLRGELTPRLGHVPYGGVQWD